MIFVVVLLWIITVSLFVYAVVSDKSTGGSGPLPPLNLPAIPQYADFIRLAGNEFSICTPQGSIISNNGISGNGFYAVAEINDEFYGKIENSGCNSFAFSSLVNNTWKQLGTNVSALYSSTYSTQHLIDFYLSNYTEETEIVGTLSKPVAITVTNNSVTIQSTKNITAGNNITFGFWSGEDENNPYDDFEVATVVNNTVSATITGLTTDAVYYFVCEAYNESFFIESPVSNAVTVSSP